MFCDAGVTRGHCLAAQAGFEFPKHWYCITVNTVEPLKVGSTWTDPTLTWETDESSQ